jgi:hypothetical protein
LRWRRRREVSSVRLEPRAFIDSSLILSNFFILRECWILYKRQKRLNRSTELRSGYAGTVGESSHTETIIQKKPAYIKAH